MRVLLLFVGAILVSVEGVSFTPFATEDTGTFEALRLEPCHIGGLPEEIRCGVHEVFEDRVSNTGRRLPIQVAVLPALRRGADPDPLFIFAGGPGQGARGFAEVAARYFRNVRRSRDIVLVDLRGTGDSAALRCPEAEDELTRLAPGAFTGRMRECLTALEADVRLYTHDQSLQDADEIRRRLGYERLNLWGGSWGTRAALLYALRFPGATRTVVLDGAVPLDLGFPLTASADAHAALERVLADCASNGDCASAFPDPRALLRDVDRRFAAGPVTVHIQHPRSGAATAIVLHRDALAEIVRGTLYVPRDSVALLQIARHAADGDFGPLAAQFLRTAAATTDDMAMGATLSILCSEDLPGVAAADIVAGATGSFFGTGYGQGWMTGCRDWPKGAPLRSTGPVVSNAPALILSGVHDPVTPPRTGDAMGRHFPLNWHIIVPGAAHNASFGGCVPDLIAAFIDRGGADGLDTSCATTVAWPPYVVSDAGTRP